ncbi:MAG: PD-(D/E)XK nuclease family protein [Treponema sp.]|jgi:hypothetical protein|nr:PD-(D/E)XK nuclease family protein [Treponema sp.]
MTITNKLNLPAGLMKAVSTERHNAEGCLSATTLIQGVKQIILTDRHWEELSDDVSDRIWAIWGQAVHSLLESEGENDFSEQEMAYQAGDITITGRIDNYDMKNGIICDYKTASVYKVKAADYEDWYLQGMIYAWLLSKNRFPVNRCRFIALLKDHSKTEAKREYQYPKLPVYVYEFPVTAQGLFKIGLFIKHKVDEYKRCIQLADDTIPPCTPEERWDRPPKFAVMKDGLKRAVRLFDDREAADRLAEEKGAGHYVEHRPGESVKCRSYCLCCDYCDYYRKSVLGAGTENAGEKAAA